MGTCSHVQVAPEVKSIEATYHDSERMTAMQQVTVGGDGSGSPGSVVVIPAAAEAGGSVEACQYPLGHPLNPGPHLPWPRVAVKAFSKPVAEQQQQEEEEERERGMAAAAAPPPGAVTIVPRPAPEVEGIPFNVRQGGRGCLAAARVAPRPGLLLPLPQTSSFLRDSSGLLYPKGPWCQWPRKSTLAKTSTALDARTAELLKTAAVIPTGPVPRSPYPRLTQRRKQLVETLVGSLRFGNTHGPRSIWNHQ